MGADREGGARRRPGRAVAYAVCGAVLLAGCASMPDSGDLRDVESTPRQDTGVRVFAMPPAENASSIEIMQGFLEALTSDDPNYDTARKYLTPEAARAWRPQLSTTVLANGPGIEGDRPEGGREDDDSHTFVLTGSRVAAVDAQQAYAPVAGSYRESVHLTKSAKSGQWRIDAPPEGVVMGKSDFQRNYTSVNKYYFASGTRAEATGQPVTVADPVFVRSKVDAMTQMVRSLLDGPTNWLRPVVRSSFPTGTALQKGVSGLTPDDRNRLTVPLNGRGSRVGPVKCAEMATQLLYTLRNLTPTLESVELQGPGGHRSCSLTQERAESVAWEASAQRPEYLYFLDGRHRLVRLPSGGTGTGAAAVPGALGTGDEELRSVAVSRDEHTVAGIGDDGRSLYVASLASGGSLGNALVTSQGATGDQRLTTPSWDARGDLWVADRDPRRPRLYVLRKGAGKPVEVAVPDLPGDIQGVRVAADGVRIALVVQKGGTQSLLIGRIEYGDKPGEEPAVVAPRPAAPDLEQVGAMSWAGDSRLVVVGSEQGGVHQMRYVEVDGSALDGPAPSAVTGVKAIAASEDERVPLVAYQEDGIVRLPSGGQWQKVDKDGTAPVYPG
ncbi:LpqB family beta-propeller domain-containing protein [Streptomyces sp. TG1A-8]|uniref:LpqB family beta-propeller domain-containing protein n=1 Tax=Streptomyces sp. TG1A-8 TaxID=3051385 RepID=UPI00265BB9A4|nr:LpqB family beta-propeller domain-containing protein [Streptomyces sp. TG1A-8]MDO0927434.1 LpqB family beta-propeller domain-containing protein [Streptomyces sp. TG1A-8]